MRNKIKSFLISQTKLIKKCILFILYPFRIFKQNSDLKNKLELTTYILNEKIKENEHLKKALMIVAGSIAKSKESM